MNINRLRPTGVQVYSGAISLELDKARASCDIEAPPCTEAT